jgi:hypothetical protein
MMGIALRRLLVAAALSLVAHAQTVQLGMFTRAEHWTGESAH